jgi:hypothetical protein
VLFYTGTGYETYYNLSLGRWVRQGLGFDSQDGFIIAPGVGMLVLHANPADTNEILEIGEVRYNDFRRPVALGTTGLNFASLGFPVDASPASLGMTVENGFVAATSVGNSTQILNWVGDTSFNVPGWATNFQLFSSNWRTQGALATVTTNAPLFRRSRANQVDVQANQLDWTHPLPWDPAPWVQP